MAEGKGLSLTILGIVAVVAILGLVLLFKTATSGGVVIPYGADKVYGGATRASQSPWSPSWVSGGPVTPEDQKISVIGGKSATWRQPSRFTQPCGSGKIEVTENRASAYSNCAGPNANGQYCCDAPGAQTGPTGAVHANLVPDARTLCALAVDEYVETCSGSNAKSGECSNLRSNILANCIGNR